MLNLDEPFPAPMAGQEPEVTVKVVDAGKVTSATFDSARTHTARYELEFTAASHVEWHKRSVLTSSGVTTLFWWLLSITPLIGDRVQFHPKYRGVEYWDFTAWDPVNRIATITLRPRPLPELQKRNRLQRFYDTFRESPPA